MAANRYTGVRCVRRGCGYTETMRLFTPMALVLLVAASGQTRKPVRKPPPPAPPIKVVPVVTCPTPLGIGVTTKVSFCDVMTGRDPSAGMLIAIPPHQGR